MCYHCVTSYWLTVAPEVLKQQGNARATAALLAAFEQFAFALQSAKCFYTDHVDGHANPLTFATAVVAEQMVVSIEQDGANLSPDRMLRFLRQALRRMNTVEDLNPYGRAVVGVEEMPAVLLQLNDMLLPDKNPTKAAKKEGTTRDTPFAAYTAPLGPAPWPNLAAAVASAADHPADRPLCVLLSTGAMSPPHRGHVDMQVRARRALETQGYAVLHGWVSPSHDLYVGPKARSKHTFFANAAHRVAMVDRATSHLPWCSVGTWEAREEGHWPDFPEVIRALQETIHAIHDEGGRAKEIHVFYVCGTDHARMCSRGFDVKNLQGLVVVPRDTDTAFKDKPSRLVYGVHEPNAEVAAVSSTAVRAAFAAGHLDRAEGMLGRGVTEYCCEHSLYGAPAMEEGAENGEGEGKGGEGGEDTGIAPSPPS